MSDGDSKKLAITMEGEREIRMQHEFAASRERVFEAMTDPDQLAQWWGPRAYETIIDQCDARSGGSYRFIHRRNDEEHSFRGVFREVTAPQRLVMTFEWEGMPGFPCLETIELEDLGGDRTRVVSTTVFFTEEERDGMAASGMEEGATESYERLEELLAA